ncbi:MAG: preprotein translocase subunit SecG [Campylobacterales bacterium]
MTGLLFILQIVFVVIIVILVLLQKSSSMGLGAYSSSNDSLFGAAGPMNFLTKATIVVGFLFILNTLGLVYLYNQQARESAWNRMKSEQSTSVPTLPTDNR